MHRVRGFYKNVSIAMSEDFYCILRGEMLLAVKVFFGHDMSKILLVIISGQPCTGKTTFGKKIAREFRLPFISKDDIKESLFDVLGVKDRGWSKKLGLAAYKVLYYFTESLLAAGKSAIIESNFKAEYDSERFLDFQKKYAFTPVQIMCRTDGEILFERFKKRAESGKRYPGHVDQSNYDEFKNVLLEGYHAPLDISGKVFDIDTTVFESIDYEKLFETIRSATNDNSYSIHGLTKGKFGSFF